MDFINNAMEDKGKKGKVFPGIFVNEMTEGKSTQNASSLP